MTGERMATAFLGAPSTERTVAGALAVLWSHAEGSWPSVTSLSAEAFFEALGLQVGHRLEALAALRVSDVFLAKACLAADAAALAHFERAIMNPARSVLARLGEPDFRDDVVQRMRERLLMTVEGVPPRLGQYTGQGSLLNWVRSSLYRLGLTMRRLDHPAENSEELATLPDAAWPLELQYIRVAHRDAFAQAFREALAALDEQGRTVLRLNLAEKLSIDQLAVVYGVHRATVARWVVRARTALTTQVEATLKERLSLETAEYDALLESLQQNLEVSLARMMGDDSNS